ncbi:hypothetical protein DFP72DRAFT_1059717 [Ephemerocybe angulata]|uniref:Fumarylacetoacetase-like C-terminal domain-containing protein n=1 Tax=Ephemerocybe angulata TaxID=980116 RepID=A0A8H6IG01_9AGAR|nr:hypothetical protein DFP72DRAFT_1059717 [Tulosesus angulatus]
MSSAFARTGKKIVAIGRNYAAHAKELGNAVPKETFFFLKPTSSYVQNGGKVEIPQGLSRIMKTWCGLETRYTPNSDIHPLSRPVAQHVLLHNLRHTLTNPITTYAPQVELGVVIGKTGRDISPADAKSHISGYTLAVDMTARNLQDRVKKAGLPWSAAKGFDTFTPIGSFIPSSDIAEPHALQLKLDINGVTKQDGSTADMIFDIPSLIAHVSGIMTLEEGDVLLTGTPPGVGPVVPGDRVECSLKDKEGKQLASLVFDAVQRQGGYKFTA